MNDVKHLTLEELVDTLSTQTSLFIQMHSEGASETEFQECKQLIQAIQEEIKSRKKVNSE